MIAGHWPHAKVATAAKGKDVLPLRSLRPSREALTFKALGWKLASRCDGLAFNAEPARFAAMPATSYRYLTKRPGVRSGRTIIEGTRLGVHDVIGLLQNGETIDTLIARCFPDLTRAQVYECLAYYEDHRIEIDALVAEQMAEGPERPS